MIILLLLIFVVVMKSLPVDFYLDAEGIAIAPGFDHLCVLERLPGIDFGGRPRCWGRNDFQKTEAPKEVRNEV